MGTCDCGNCMICDPMGTSQGISQSQEPQIPWTVEQVVSRAEKAEKLLEDAKYHHGNEHRDRLAAEAERDQLQQRAKELEAEAEANHIPATTMTKCETHGTWYKPSEGCALCLKERVKDLEGGNRYNGAEIASMMFIYLDYFEEGKRVNLIGIPQEIVVKERDTYREALERKEENLAGRELCIDCGSPNLLEPYTLCVFCKSERDEAALAKGEPAPRRTAPPKAGLESGICEKVD